MRSKLVINSVKLGIVRLRFLMRVAVKPVMFVVSSLFMITESRYVDSIIKALIGKLRD